MSDPRSTPPLPPSIDALVERWHADTFPETVAAHDVRVWNLVHAAKDDLKARLAAALAPSPASKG